MANTLLTPSIIAKEAIMVLQNTMVFAGLVHRNYSNEFAKVGDTITIRKPSSFTASEWGGSEITVQNATESSVAVKMDKIVDVSFAVTSKDMSLSIEDFSAQFIQPAMRAHAQYLDSLLAGLYVDVPYYTVVGSTPGIADLAAIGRIMNQNKVPMDGRNLVLDPVTYAKYVVLDAVLHAEKSGSTEALRAASMGRVLGLDTYMDQNIKTHTAGAGTTGKAAIDLVAGYSAGATSIHVDAVTAALKVGDLITIADNPYVITKASALATADQDIDIYPALKADAANDAEVIIVGNGVGHSRRKSAATLRLF
jgi:hypothetical protein